ncbi:hypothetical protein JTE90_006132 [Oedothorax gibbosus]|uniref:Solute carrier family 25 member 40 n=1 Tax=Oedothorax gibbosus TaxID=931172 RepID=A0AAV6V644_9ARAC|nr:hypothetical protein JTE90_006132 [Oedothorax gibbosus]
MADNTFLPTQITPMQQMISSCTGALLTSVFVTPLDVVKIRLQAQQGAHSCFLRCNGFVEELCCLLHAPPRLPTHLTGTMDAFVKITRAEGMASLWSGLPPTLLMAVPSTVVYFTVYDQIRGGLMRRRRTAPSPPLWLPVLAGGTARAISATLISPLELVRTKMQSQKLSYFAVWCAVREEVRGEAGVRALWRGLGPTIARDVPFSCVYWLSYEWLKADRPTPSFLFSFCAGATSGTVAALLTLPFDVVKTHRQIALGAPSQRAVSTLSLMKNLYQTSGYKALFAGGVPRVVKVAPACAIMISTYEYGKRFFHCRNTARADPTRQQ